jgi:purine nucleosidase
MRILRLVATFVVVGTGAAFWPGTNGNLPAAVAAAQTAEKSASPQLAILDTDIGDDIDDAFALALLLQSPEVRLLGITTAFGKTRLRAALVDRFLDAVGRKDIPEYVGMETNAGNVFTQAAYANRPVLDRCQAQLLSVSGKGVPQGELRKAASCEEDRQDAVGFILRSAREHPGAITLIAIGPLTNVKAAIDRDAATFRKMKRVVMMGGSVYRGYGDEHRPPEPEWNIDRDPEAAQALFASGVPIFMMPLDSTQIHLAAADRERIFSFGSPVTDQLTLLYHQWVAHTDNHAADPTLFDPVAATYAIRPELCPMKPLRIEVDAKGFTRPVDGAPNAQVCLKSDQDGFLAFLLSRVANSQPNAAH